MKEPCENVCDMCLQPRRHGFQPYNLQEYIEHKWKQIAINMSRLLMEMLTYEAGKRFGK